MAVEDDVAAVLAAEPGSTAREIAARLGLDKGTVNAVLYRFPARFRRVGDAPPGWWNQGDDRTAAPTVDAPAVPVRPAIASPAPLRARTERLPALYQWQEEALRAWQARGRRGVVEAVTGTGKTMVGIAAIADGLRRGRACEVVVPKKELARQWEDKLRECLPGVRLGFRGDNQYSTLAECDVLVSIVNTAAKYDPVIPEGGGLLVADECHGYGGETFSRALDDGYHDRLGLTATYERNDDGVALYLDPFFEGVCFRMGYRRAIDDGVVARFRVALVAVPFSSEEQGRYDELSRVMGDARRKLVAAGVPEEPFGVFMKHVSDLKEQWGLPLSRPASRYLSAFTERRDLLSHAESKTGAVDVLVPALRAADRSIVFTESIERADSLAARVKRAGLSSDCIHGDLDDKERRTSLARFANGETKVLAAPRLLDEGIDVPAADLAVIVSASRTRRQMIQRMGRVLRKKLDGRSARFVILYVAGSGEDPARGAHEAFLDEVLDVADEHEQFTLRDRDRLTAFLDPSRPNRRTAPSGGRTAAAPPATPAARVGRRLTAEEAADQAITAKAAGRQPTQIARDLAASGAAAKVIVSSLVAARFTPPEIAIALRNVHVAVAAAAAALADRVAADRLASLLAAAGYPRRDAERAVANLRSTSRAGAGWRMPIADALASAQRLRAEGRNPLSIAAELAAAGADTPTVASALDAAFYTKTDIARALRTAGFDALTACRGLRAIGASDREMMTLLGLAGYPTPAAEAALRSVTGHN